LGNLVREQIDLMNPMAIQRHTCDNFSKKIHILCLFIWSHKMLSQFDLFQSSQIKHVLNHLSHPNSIYGMNDD
jgi:hypothetical protein